MLIEILLRKISKDKVKAFTPIIDEHFNHDERYRFTFEDGNTLEVNFGEVWFIFFGWFTRFSINGTEVYRSYNPFIKLWALWVVKNKVAKLIKEELKV